MPFDARAFEKAKAERKFVLLDGAAEWCHWCHVMDAETYHDPRVEKVLTGSFVATRVDIDERPDVQERYADYGWPATVLFSPDGVELGAYRGYLPPDRMLEVLGEVVANVTAQAAEESRVAVPREGGGKLDSSELTAQEKALSARLDGYYDPKEGGFGTFQKAPIGWGNAWLLRRAKEDPDARKRALYTLEKQAALIDPVWGGIYQYSEGATWEKPHFEKLMTFQAPALENYAEAYALGKDPRMLERARAMRRYMSEFLRAGALFGATQDADLNAHEVGKTYLTGHAYYALDDAHRRALGIPRVERRAYAKENGLAIAAYVTYAEATGDATALVEASETAKAIVGSHTLEKGGFSHEKRPTDTDGAIRRFFLADNAVLGFALLRLYEHTHEAWLLDAAKGAARRMTEELWDETRGGFYSASVDPNAVGVFRKRRMPLDENAFAVRFLVRLARATNDPALGNVVARTLFATLTPENVEDRGRMLGEVILAVADARALLSGH